jgi:aldehyde:ferredoxin oxidoreductase
MILKGAYMGKILRVDLSGRKYTIESINKQDIMNVLGGRGLAAKIYYDEIGPEVRPFDPGNKIIFMTGPMTGVRLPSTTKFQLSTKSPETGMYLCSNSGGEFGPELKKCGFDGLIIEGSADTWTYLMIKDKAVTFCDARQMQGMTSTETLKLLREASGDKKSSALSIGPAGEKLVRFSFVNVDTRAFGRGGAGENR